MGVTQWWRRVTGKDGRDEQAGAGAQRAPRPRPTGAPQPKGRPGRRPDPDTSLPVMGVDACKGGWVGAVLDAAGHGTPLLVVRPTVAELVAEAGPLAVVALHVPMGLPDRTRREADVQTRRMLGPAASSVFTTPVRDAVYAATFGEANQVNRERLGSGISQQAYGLRSRIVEVDAWLRQDLPFVVVEVQPEASFTEMTGAPLESRKRSAQGAEDRRRALAANGVAVPGTLPVGVGADDVVDACAAAWSAHRVKVRQARTIPETPETFSDGIHAAIHV